MPPETQKLEDMLAILQQQRDQALNALVQVQAEATGYRRRINELEAKLAEQQEPVKKPKAA